jgi:opacity protein-like surface antigen
VRGEVGRDWIGVESAAFTSGLRPLSVSVNLVYNWERSVWRPYVSAGLGLYRYTAALSSQALLDPTLRDQLIALGLNPGSGSAEGSDKKFGIDLGGGIERFFSGQMAIVADLRYHPVGDIVAIIPFEGSFFSLSVGVKRYF